MAFCTVPLRVEALSAAEVSFYGIANQLYSLDSEIAPLVATVLNVGGTGAQVEILGQGFTSTNTILMNGKPATFVVVSDTFLTTMVPPRAQSGPIQVITPAGTL